MASSVALVLCGLLVAVLLRNERGRSPDVSGAMWVPTLWLLLCGSKPLARWFEGNAMAEVGGDETGSPLDRLVLSILIGLAVVILFRRRIQWSQVVRDNLWLVVFFLYLGLSVLWSDYPSVSLKRWVRLSAAVLIAMVFLTEKRPLSALESAFRRCAYILIPVSLLLIKYFPNLGIAYVSWSGEKMWVGVASQKNGLGTISAISAFFIIWSFYRQWRQETLFTKKWQMVADGLVLGIAVFLLRGFGGAYSATSIGILLLGAAALVVLSRVRNRVRGMATLLVLGLAAGLLSLGSVESVTSGVTSAFQRDASFTGRTDIWNAVLEVASRKPWFGVGYGGYWGLADDEIYSALGVHEAHSGYLDVYLGVGIVGIVLLCVFLLAYYRKVLRELTFAYEWGLFGICILLMILVHNFTESNFIRTSSYIWNVMVFLTVVFSEPLFRQPATLEDEDGKGLPLVVAHEEQVDAGY